mmetsp:Transcript_7240/g.19040  ORF Transcript_7240/g.19040 Transcript_7240/m.19040 type:complete len:284 (-) Transcript_7240:37-888(-)
MSMHGPRPDLLSVNSKTPRPRGRLNSQLRMPVHRANRRWRSPDHHHSLESSLPSSLPLSLPSISVNAGDASSRSSMIGVPSGPATTFASGMPSPSMSITSPTTRLSGSKVSTKPSPTVSTNLVSTTPSPVVSTAHPGFTVGTTISGLSSAGASALSLVSAFLNEDSCSSGTSNGREIEPTTLQRASQKSVTFRILKDSWQMCTCERPRPPNASGSPSISHSHSTPSTSSLSTRLTTRRVNEGSVPSGPFPDIWSVANAGWNESALVKSSWPAYVVTDPSIRSS